MKKKLIEASRKENATNEAWESEIVFGKLPEVAFKLRMKQGRDQSFPFWDELMIHDRIDTSLQNQPDPHQGCMAAMRWLDPLARLQGGF